MQGTKAAILINFSTLISYLSMIFRNRLWEVVKLSNTRILMHGERFFLCRKAEAEQEACKKLTSFLEIAYIFFLLLPAEFWDQFWRNSDSGPENCWWKQNREIRKFILRWRRLALTVQSSFRMAPRISYSPDTRWNNWNFNLIGKSKVNYKVDI